MGPSASELSDINKRAEAF